ncbi:DUF4229 domain-containing protein [Leucobacter sp. HY1908]
MKSSRSAWTMYVSLRLLFFVVPFGIVYWLGLQLGFTLALSGGVAAVIAALISVSLSVIFLSRPRAQAAQSIADWRSRDRTADDVEEDDALDGEAPSEASAAEVAPAGSAGVAPAESAVVAPAESAGDPEQRTEA